MYLHIIKIKINIYIFYTSLREQRWMSVDPSFTLNRTEIWGLEILPPGLNLWLVCTRKTKSLRSRPTFFFPCLQVVLSLEDHSSEVQVVKHLLHNLSLLPLPSPHLFRVLRRWTLLPSSSSRRCSGVWRASRGQTGVGVVVGGWSQEVLVRSLLHRNVTAMKVTGFCAFHQRSSCKESAEMTKRKRPRQPIRTGSDGGNLLPVHFVATSGTPYKHARVRQLLESP